MIHMTIKARLVGVLAVRPKTSFAALAASVLVAIGALVATTSPALAIGENHASITCEHTYINGIIPVTVVYFKAWGLGYPTNREFVKVYRHLWDGNTYVDTVIDPDLPILRGGTWSTATEEMQFYGHHLFSLIVAVEGPNGEDWGPEEEEGYAECMLTDPA
jgi:hypothetical protein